MPLMIIGRDKEWSIESAVSDGKPENEIGLFEGKWQELITKQAELNHYSEVLFARGVTHSIHLERPDIIVESVKKMEKLIQL